MSQTSAFSVLFVAGLLAVTIGCSSKQRTSPGSATSSSSPSKVSGGESRRSEDAGRKAGGGFQLPSYEERRLANGLRILFVPDRTLPYVSYSLLIRSGAAQDPEGFSGLSSMVAELLDKGTKKRTAPQIAADLGQIGAEFDASSSSEYSMVSGSSLASQAEVLLKNLAEVVTQPTFSMAEIERLRKQMLAGIERRIDSPDSFTAVAFDAFLFGEHPYARPVSGTARTVKAIKKKHIIQHYLRHYRPNNSILAVVGQYTPELMGRIESEFAQWQARDVVPVAYPQPAAFTGLNVLLADKPGLVQSQIRMGDFGIKRKNEDFLSIRLANTILGGAFASRLNNRVRKELGLTYSISSAFDARLDRGPFLISTFTKNNTVGQTLTETLKTLSDFHDKGVVKEEVEQARGYLKGVFPQSIETPEKLAFNLLLLRFYEIPDSYLTNYLSEIDRLSVADINKTIKTYFAPKNLKAVVFSNAAETQEQLQKLVQAAGGKLEVKKATDLQ